MKSPARVFAAAMLLGVLVAPPQAWGDSASWQPAGSMHVPRGLNHTGTALPGGDLLVTGGEYDGPGGNTAAADLYDHPSGTWSAVPDMSVARSRHSATRLHNGRVIVAGGFSCDPSCGEAIYSSVEIFDRTTKTWSPAAPMAAARSFHTAVLLHDGRVLVTGGLDAVAILATSETYWPITDTWVPAAPMINPRYGHTATLLPNGQVLVTGGRGVTGEVLASAELYDPHQGTWTPTGSMSTGRSDFTATPLPGGKVLVAGGVDLDEPVPAGFVPSATTEIYDPKAGTWTAGGLMTSPRFGHVAVALNGGGVLVAGGEDKDVSPVASAEVYDPATLTWTETAPMSTARAFAVASPLPGGSVLVAGGFFLHDPLATSERYVP